MNILVTGSAGFIGFHLVKKLCSEIKNVKILGIDNLNNYYDINLKKDRNKKLKKNKQFKFIRADIRNKAKLLKICKQNKVKIIIHLAAQAGVRYSIFNPSTYFENNLLGTFNILEVAKDIKVKHLMIASSSSVYGSNSKFPLKEHYNTDTPLSFYAATKKSCEVLAHSYSNIFKTPITMLRFFTVYGTFGRPDMALFKFTKSIINKTKLNLFNGGDHMRDFTNIDDVCNILLILKDKVPKNNIPFDIINLGGGKPKRLKYFLNLIEKNTSKKAKVRKLSMQQGDVKKTVSCTNKLIKKTNYRHKTSLEKGIKEFVKWYIGYFKN